MIMVDEIQIWPHARHRCFMKGSAHLTCDGDLDELHAFAASIGLRRSWFQPHVSAPHYDLSPARHAAAIAAGAVFVSARDQARERLRKRHAAAAVATGKPCACLWCRPVGEVAVAAPEGRPWPP